MLSWSREQIEIEVDRAGQKRSVVRLDQPFARIGGNANSDVVLAGVQNAKRSLYVQATPEGLVQLDLTKPKEGGRINCRWLNSAKAVEFAPYQLRIRYPGEQGDSAPPPRDLLEPREEPPFPSFQISYRKRPSIKRRLRARLSLIGRYPGCALRLQGKLVSGFHCALYWEQGRLWCIDLNSSNQTQLNDRPIECAEVAIGDRLTIGEFTLVFHHLSHSGVAESSLTLDAQEDSLPSGAGSSPTIFAGTDGDGGSGVGSSPHMQEADFAPAHESTANDSVAIYSRNGMNGSDQANGTLVAASPVPMSAPTADERWHEALVEQVSQLTRERGELQAHWEKVAESLQGQVEQLQREATRLTQERESLEQSHRQERELLERARRQEREALEQERREEREALEQARKEEREIMERDCREEREALEQARRQWDVERSELTRQLLLQSDRMLRIEAELLARSAPEVATDEVSATREEPEMDDQIEASAEILRRALEKPDVGDAFERLRALMVPAAPSHELIPGPTAVSLQVAELPDPVNTVEAEDAEFEVAGGVHSADDSAEDVAPAESSADSTPARGRGKVARENLSDYIGDRLVEFDQKRRRRQLIIWGGTMLATTCLVAISIVVWCWLGPLIVR